MLASLLPGLRDVRTPLTVGYLWLLTAWLLFGEYVPRSRPPGNGLVAQLFDLGGLLGSAAPIAALSFIAYLLGALLTIPVESRSISGALTRLSDFSMSRDARLTTREYAGQRGELAAELRNQLKDSTLKLSLADTRALGDFGGGPLKLNIPTNDLRTRLLVANQELYGEYDRLAAEASFRVNMTPPLLVLALLLRSISTPSWDSVLLLEHWYCLCREQFA
jgi:hypothetical protein